DDDFEKVRIQFSLTEYPPDRNDGTNIYEGTGESKSHTGLVNGQRYYYSAFTVDDVGNWSTGAHASAVAGIGGPDWPDDTRVSPVLNFRAYGDETRIKLTWTNPKVDNYTQTWIRYTRESSPGSGPDTPIDQYPVLYTEGWGIYSGTIEYQHYAATKGLRYYFSAIVQAAGRFSDPRFASAIAGRGQGEDDVPGTLVEVSDTEEISGGGCLSSQAGLDADYIAEYGCMYSGIDGYYSTRLSFSKRGSASEWLKFKIEWDVYNFMSTGEKIPNHISRREREIGIRNDLALSFSQSCKIATVTVSKISERAEVIKVQVRIAYTGPRRVGWHYKIRLTLEGRA
ncbi:hypothetical protein KAR91_38350, partial [Candidatus Pacearchaeota archaeon]|nr:hypothetical protein [Candidatus Pacearchaeota archaeon]